MEEGVYESLLTERLNELLAQRRDLHSEQSNVDDAEQPLRIARHLSPIIERSLRAAGTADARTDLVHRILSALADPDALAEAIHQDQPDRITRLDAISRAETLVPQQ